VSTRFEILRCLADGSFHSGPEIGAALGVTRAAVHKGIQGLRASGLEVHRVPGRGYRLDGPVELLSKERILTQAGKQAEALADRLHIFAEIDSTSGFLLQLPAHQRHGAVCIAEAQSRGRGRRGRTWQATPYRNILMSMAWRLDAGPAAITGISLAAGVAVVRALQEWGVADAGLKWPNDVVWEGRKLAGLLLDVQGEAAGPSHVVLGLGLNVQIAEAEAAAIDQPWADLYSISGGTVDRNALVVLLLRHLQTMFTEFARDGLNPFRHLWQDLHCYTGRTVRILQPDRVTEGKVRGIDERGALLVVDRQGHTHTFHSGEISLRAGA
jgi:BirA family biotin operon repressor/biotin-[acetyl-CoA-carboxylase] ligase